MYFSVYEMQISICLAYIGHVSSFDITKCVKRLIGTYGSLVFLPFCPFAPTITINSGERSNEKYRVVQIIETEIDLVTLFASNKMYNPKIL